MATYTGMNLKGEIRESISLDEDDMSDVEDEVFIRDGKHGYKLAEEINMKRPLMATRRKTTKSTTNGLSKTKMSCKVLCKPCCYICASLSIFMGLITIVVIIVSIYPLPLDKLKEWTIKKSILNNSVPKLSPCNNLNVKQIWSVNFPYIQKDSSLRTLDINNDNYEDILFGFGVGDNYNVEKFCEIFMETASPCAGGLIALNGINGEIIWKKWFNDSMYSLQCNFDINLDHINDCLSVGEQGTIVMFNPTNGSVIWRLNMPDRGLYVANFIPDQNNDSFADILASHSSFNQDVKDGHLLLISGKDGQIIQKVEISSNKKTFYMPQIFQTTNKTYVLLGTGSTNSPGNLILTPLDDILTGHLSMNRTSVLYKDKFKGVITPSILVDLTGDQIDDIVTAMFNSTVIAFNGSDLNVLWNFTIAGINVESVLTATPAYFTSDNVTDFFVVYQSFDDILNTTFTQAFIIDGKTGESIYSNPITGGVYTQMSAIDLSVKSFGYDMYLFWTSDCGKDSNNDCKNKSKTFKLNALSQYHQPPGFTIFTSETIKDLNDTSPFVLFRKYYKDQQKLMPHETGQIEINPSSKIVDNKPIKLNKYGSNNENDIPDYVEIPRNSQDNYNYNDYDDGYNNINNIKVDGKNRDPRQHKNYTTKKKNLDETIYDLSNIRRARNQLLHDLDHIPNEILKETYVKNRKSKFTQRDTDSHLDKTGEGGLFDEQNNHFNLWDLESEKELAEKLNGEIRKKRNNVDSNEIFQVISVGNVLDSTSNKSNVIDVVFAIYHLPPAPDLKTLLQKDVTECLINKINDDNKDMEERLRQECLEEQEIFKNDVNYFLNLSKVRHTHMLIYRLSIECECASVEEKCADFLPKNQQNWCGYLGNVANGTFFNRN